MKQTLAYITAGSKQNLMTYCLFLVIALIGLFYGNLILSNFKFLRVWELNAVLFLLAGVPFLFFQEQAGLPNFWQKDISPVNRFLVPVSLGIGFGLLDVLVVKIILHPEPFHELPPFLQPFPYSLFLYFSGAVEVEVFYRLIPLTIILAFGKWFKKGRYYMTFFWIGSSVTALREPLEQFPSGPVGFIIYSLFTGFLMNFLQAIWYKKAGFLASLTIRLGHYLIWHIILGIYVEFYELQ
ncbi:hypothetical protein GO755_08995 [Spirosoma sp. HMF4905]|uniref:CPBP family intramembrane metalloprotease n=1 Tax=Spirosoma arboris TaxID=2682092 RepID=A0A7K1S932_9BACT|nr:hypothetical protein [Spirosoma arboris]MVM30168.1 hypothetical protein [Spirosoma arboris]